MSLVQCPDKRRWAGSDQWHYIRRQLRSVSHETTCYNRHNNISPPRKLNFSVGFLERKERELYPSYPWLEWAVRGCNQRRHGVCVTTQLSTYFGNNRNSQRPLIGPQRHFELHSQCPVRQRCPKPNFLPIFLFLKTPPRGVIGHHYPSGSQQPL